MDVDGMFALNQVECQNTNASICKPAGVKMPCGAKMQQYAFGEIVGSSILLIIHLIQLQCRDILVASGALYFVRILTPQPSPPISMFQSIISQG